MSQTIFVGLTLFISYCNGFIVPQELPSILSLVYSNIPPIKKGTDSRVGFGFRLGDHADFQVQFELGPQKFTKPIGNSASDDEESSDTSKRMVNQEDYHKEINKEIKSPNIDGTQWLNSWSNNMKTKGKEGSKLSEQTDNHPEINAMQNLFNPKLPVVPTVPLISQSALSQLQQLYGTQREIKPYSTATDASIGTLSADKMESHLELAKVLKHLNKDKITEDLKDVSFD